MMTKPIISIPGSSPFYSGDKTLCMLVLVALKYIGTTIEFVHDLIIFSFTINFKPNSWSLGSNLSPSQLEISYMYAQMNSHNSVFSIQYVFIFLMQDFLVSSYKPEHSIDYVQVCLTTHILYVPLVNWYPNYLIKDICTLDSS